MLDMIVIHSTVTVGAMNDYSLVICGIALRVFDLDPCNSRSFAITALNLTRLLARCCCGRCSGLILLRIVNCARLCGTLGIVVLLLRPIVDCIIGRCLLARARRFEDIDVALRVINIQHAPVIGEHKTRLTPI